jgi:hypothetical protein
MPPVSRFTTSKFRNAQLHPAARPELLRGQLPFSASAASTTGSAANSTFSSEIKTNYSYVVTVSPTGDLSFRAYSSGTAVGAAKVASGVVGDWDLSRLDDGLVVVGDLDGCVSLDSDIGLFRSIHTDCLAQKRVSLRPLGLSKWTTPSHMCFCTPTRRLFCLRLALQARLRFETWLLMIC